MKKEKRRVVNTITYTVLIFILGCNAQENGSDFKWSYENEKVHNSNRNDSTKWSSKTWKADTQSIKLGGKPMINGIFPVPDYDLVDSTFRGLGYSGNWEGYKLRDKKVIFHSLYVNKNATNKEYIDDEPDEVFFTIAVLTDSIDLKRFSHTGVSITSRNHPHYVGQGFVKTRSNEIDFVSFLTADRNDYAIVNMRLFDLKIGRIVLIAPQKDMTLRSLQLDAPIMSSGQMDNYIENLISKDSEIIDFFTKKGNI